jgi:accessory gene regulator B
VIKKFAKNISCFYVEQGIINDDKDVYAYGIELLLSTLCNFVAVVIIALVMDVLAGALLYQLSFVLLRSFAGGYHAKSHIGCIGAYSALFLVFALLVEYLPTGIMPLYILICAIIAALIIWAAAPAEAPNKPLSDRKRMRLKNNCALIGSIFMILAIASYYIPYLQGSLMCFLFSGFLAAASSLLFAVKIQKYQEKEVM